MASKLYFAGSIYKQIKRGKGIKEVIQRAEGICGHLMTSWNGRPALVTDGKLYVFIGKQKGFKSIDWKR